MLYFQKAFPSQTSHHNSQSQQTNMYIQSGARGHSIKGGEQNTLRTLNTDRRRHVLRWYSTSANSTPPRVRENVCNRACIKRCFTDHEEKHRGVRFVFFTSWCNNSEWECGANFYLRCSILKLEELARSAHQAFSERPRKTSKNRRAHYFVFNEHWTPKRRQVPACVWRESFG